MEPLLKGLESARLQIRVVWYCYQLLTMNKAVKLVKENANTMNQTAQEGVLYKNDTLNDGESLKSKNFLAETIHSFLHSTST